MSRVVGVEPCWVVRDASGQPWTEDHDTHFTNQAEALDEIEELRENHGSDQSPEEDAAALAAVVPEGPSRDAAYLQALESYRRDDERLPGLRAVPLPELCYTVSCDGEGVGCDEWPDSEEFGLLHFTDRYPFDPNDHAWKRVYGKDYYEECAPVSTAGGPPSVRGA